MVDALHVRLRAGSTPRIEPLDAQLTTEQRSTLGAAPWDLAVIATLVRWGYEVRVSADEAPQAPIELDLHATVRDCDLAGFYAAGVQMGTRMMPAAAPVLATVMGVEVDEVRAVLARCESWRFLESSCSLVATLRSGEKARLAPGRSRARSVKEAWERLAARGLISLEFTETPRFVSGMRGTLAPVPRSLRAAVAIASNAAAITRVESLVREVGARAQSWGMAPFDQVGWIDEELSSMDLSVGDALPMWSTCFARSFPGDHAPSRRALGELRRGRGALRRKLGYGFDNAPAIASALGYALAASARIAMGERVERWVEKVHRALSITGPISLPTNIKAPAALVDAPLDLASCPFLPLAQVECEGYALQSVRARTALVCFEYP